MKHRTGGVLVVAAAIAGGCTTPQPTDYTAFVRSDPHSILVLPPVNTTADVDAPDLFLATVTRPVAEQGYYVFPIMLVDRVMKDNGAPTPGDMHALSLRKLREVFGADAVLYIEIHDWTTKYIGIATSTQVRITYRLVDVRTSHTIWTRTAAAGENSAAYASGEEPFTAVFALFMAQVQAIGAAVGNPEVKFARRANRQAIQDPRHGLLPGPRHPRYASDPRRLAYAGASPNE